MLSVCRGASHAASASVLVLTSAWPSNSAVRRAGLSKRASCHTLRHSFATTKLVPSQSHGEDRSNGWEAVAASWDS